MTLENVFADLKMEMNKLRLVLLLSTTLSIPENRI